MPLDTSSIFHIKIIAHETFYFSKYFLFTTDAQGPHYTEASSNKSEIPPKAGFHFYSGCLVALEATRLLVRTNLLERLRLDLTDTLAGHAELLPHFFERVVHAIEEPVTHLKNLALFW